MGIKYFDPKQNSWQDVFKKEITRTVEMPRGSVSIKPMQDYMVIYDFQMDPMDINQFMSQNKKEINDDK